MLFPALSIVLRRTAILCACNYDVIQLPELVNVIIFYCQKKKENSLQFI